MLDLRFLVSNLSRAQTGLEQLLAINPISLLRLHHVPNIKAALRDLTARAGKVLKMPGL